MMQSFKKFFEAKKVPVPVANYYPSHGSHSNEEKKKKVPVANYYPSHGSHSIKEEKKEISHDELISHNPNSKIHPDVDGVHEKLNPSKSTWNESLKPHEREAVRLYTKGSHSTNKELIDISQNKPSNFQRKSYDDKWTKEWKIKAKTKYGKIVPGLDSLLNRSKVPRNLTVFHGINAASSRNFNPGELASQHPERHINIPSYISTSISPSLSASFAHPEEYRGFDKKPTTTHMLRINLKRGQKGYRYAGDRSEEPEEREGILKRNSVLKIAEHPIVVHHPETGGKIHVWDAHLVD
jgi:hypothetical protein